MGKTAILVDGAFFLRRYQSLYKKPEDQTPQAAANNLYQMCMRHLQEGNVRKGEERNQNIRVHDLYRIFFYDCAPLTKKAHLPVSKRAIDFAKSDTAVFRNALHECLKQKRKVALRLGHLSESASWVIKPTVMKEILAGRKGFETISDEDFSYDVKQKTVDMKIGLDVASLSYKKLVDQIVLISGDSDFIPAAKLARREGIDFILDPMYKNIPADLSEHIDGKRSTCQKPSPSTSARVQDNASVESP